MDLSSHVWSMVFVCFGFFGLLDSIGAVGSLESFVKEDILSVEEDGGDVWNSLDVSLVVMEAMFFLFVFGVPILDVDGVLEDVMTVDRSPIARMAGIPILRVGVRIVFINPVILLDGDGGWHQAGGIPLEGRCIIFLMMALAISGRN